MNQEIIAANKPIPEPQIVLQELLKEFPDVKGALSFDIFSIKQDFAALKIAIRRTKGWNQFEVLESGINSSHPSIRIGTIAIFGVSIVLSLLLATVGIGISVVLIVIGFFYQMSLVSSQKNEIALLEKTITDYLIKTYDGKVKTSR